MSFDYFLQSQLEIVKDLVQNHANMNLCDEIGWTPLHCAVSAGCDEIVEILLNSGALVNAQTNNQQVALHYAASKNYTR